jgi:hypothetical protein
MDMGDTSQFITAYLEPAELTHSDPYHPIWIIAERHTINPHNLCDHGLNVHLHRNKQVVNRFGPMLCD